MGARHLKTRQSRSTFFLDVAEAPTTLAMPPPVLWWIGLFVANTSTNTESMANDATLTDEL